MEEMPKTIYAGWIDQNVWWSSPVDERITYTEPYIKKSIADELYAALVAMLERNEPMMTAKFLVETEAAQKEIDVKRAENKVLIDASRAAIKSYREGV